MDSLCDLMDRSVNSVFVKALNERIPFNSKILEAGCGCDLFSAERLFCRE